MVLLPKYVQVVFEDATLTCLRAPEVQARGEVPERGSPQWLAALWSLVGREVLKAQIEGDRLDVILAEGRIRLDLREGDDAPIEIGALRFETGAEMVF